MSFIRSLYAPALLAALAGLGLAACGGGAKQATPTALVTDAATYDGQTVTVSGTAKNPRTRKTRRGTAVMYDLCDTSCIHVFQIGDATVTDGSTVNVTGRFRQSFGRIRHLDNVLIVGGRAGFGGGAQGQGPGGNGGGGSQ